MGKIGHAGFGRLGGLKYGGIGGISKSHLFGIPGYHVGGLYGKKLLLAPNPSEADGAEMEEDVITIYCLCPTNNRSNLLSIPDGRSDAGGTDSHGAAALG